MTLLIRMRGDLDSIRAGGNFQHFVDSINIAAAKGTEYVILENESGQNMALNQKNILTVTESDDDLAGMMG